ncbi:cytochrome P450 [Streptomyces albospinus]|uniref:Cytochrome P450 n=1 Tax=Streptomyces albospinus TaxID=285515 RepID=A0ABQ2UM06_9ACTN|nr:cytochrome P450 [Streptomyces albospinus]GGU44396.1 cytochrome P450 [Streptomyces albospinus]
MPQLAHDGDLSSFNNLLQPDILSDPYPVYDMVREREPVWWNEHLGSWLLLGHDDVLEALNHPEKLSSDRTSAFLGHLSESEENRFREWADMRRRMMLYNDPPRHTRLRRPVQRGMSVKLSKQMRPKIQRVVDDLIDGVIQRGECDGIQDLGYHLPVILNSELIGIPAEDRNKVKVWTADFVKAINAGGANVPIADLECGQNAILAMREYFTDLAAVKRANPQEDLLSALVRRDGNPLEGDDLVATCIVVMFAGLETALNLIGNGLLALLRNPDQLELLRAQPELMPSAVEEILRFDGPLHLVGRMATEDMTIRGREIGKGDKVLVMLGAANRDPNAYENPHKLDITRADNRHLSFSHGIHYCPGAEISRIMGELSFATILRRMGGLRLGAGELTWQPNLSFRGLKTLPLEFTPGPRKAS